MYLCKLKNPDLDTIYGMGEDPKAAMYAAQRNNHSYSLESCAITFYKVKETNIEVSFEPTFTGI